MFNRVPTAMRVPSIRHDTRAWKAQVWIGFGCAFRTMGCLFCLAAAGRPRRSRCSARSIWRSAPPGRARIGAANVTFDDHSGDKRFAGRIDTVTVDSVFG